MWALLEMYLTSAWIPIKPSKYVKYTSTTAYRNRTNCQFIRLQQNWREVLCPWLLHEMASFPCVEILHQEILHNRQLLKLRNFLYLLQFIFYLCTCIPHFKERWGSSVQEWKGCILFKHKSRRFHYEKRETSVKINVEWTMKVLTKCRSICSVYN